MTNFDKYLMKRIKDIDGILNHVSAMRNNWAVEHYRKYKLLQRRRLADSLKAKRKKFELINYDIYTKGELKGYINGVIAFTNIPDSNHEFLFRLHDPDNGNDNTIVSIDYGYKNPLLTEEGAENEIWEDIRVLLAKIGRNTYIEMKRAKSVHSL